MNVVHGTPRSRRHAEAFAHHLVNATVNLDLHALTSDHVIENLVTLTDELTAAFDSGIDSPLTIAFVGDRIILAGQPSLGASLQAGRLLRNCTELGISALKFEKGLTGDELARFLELLGSKADAFSPENLANALLRNGIHKIDVEVRRNDNLSDTPSGNEWPALSQYQAMSDVLQSNHVAAYRNKELDVNSARGVIERAVAQISAEPSSLLSLATYDDIDSFTVGHSVRVTLLALQVAIASGTSPRDTLRVGTAALLHDIGKSKIDQGLLFKPGPLSPDERREMARHARCGGEILLEQNEVDPTAVGAAFCHHIGPNGTGYPRPAVPFEPSNVSKLVRVCDVFEALTAVRPYKAALTPLHAYSVMQSMENGFDPKWMKLFIQVIGIYPIGTRIVLNSGEEAIVIAHGSELQKPRVRTILDIHGRPITANARREITVGTEQEGSVSRIEAVVGANHRIKIPRELLKIDSQGASEDHTSNCSCSLHAHLHDRDERCS